MSADGKTTFFEHIAEIRARLVRSLALYILVSVACYQFAEQAYDWLARPAEGTLVYMSPVGGMMAYMKIAFYGAAVLCSPYFLYHLYAFFAPALSAAWRRKIVAATVVAYMLFASGVLFTLWVLPTMMHYLLSFSRPGMRAVISVDHYFSFLITFTTGCALSFEMPLAAYFMGSTGLMSAATMAKQWRIAVMVIVIAAAIITPTPDLVNWAIVCVPLLLLYVVSLGVCAWAEKGRKKKMGIIEA